MRRPSFRWLRSRRRRWLGDREVKGLLPPLPVGMIEVNCRGDFVPPALARRIMRRAAEATIDGHPVDVIFGSECDGINGAELLPEFDVLHDADHPTRDGTLLAVRRTRGRLENEHYVFVAKALGGAMADRWLAVGEVHIDPGTEHRWQPDMGAGHAPPKRGWIRWPGYMRAVRRQRLDVVAADWNKLARAVWPALGRRPSMVHILGFGTRWFIPVSGPVAVDVGGDHLAVGLVLWG